MIYKVKRKMRPGNEFITKVRRRDFRLWLKEKGKCSGKLGFNLGLITHTPSTSRPHCVDVGTTLAIKTKERIISVARVRHVLALHDTREVDASWKRIWSGWKSLHIWHKILSLFFSFVHITCFFQSLLLKLSCCQRCASKICIFKG